MAETTRRERAHARCDIPSTQVVLRSGNQMFLGFARNVSRSGIFVHTVKPCRAGEEYTIEFTLPQTELCVKCRSKVAWSKNPTWIREGISSEGLVFLDIEPHVAESLDGFVMGQTA